MRYHFYNDYHNLSICTNTLVAIFNYIYNFTDRNLHQKTTLCCLGKRSRPYSHLYQALTLWKRDFKTSQDKKVQRILDIWTDKVGVICLHIFQNIIPAEAYTYEASMIDTIGLPNLKNLKRGNYYGATASWTLKERKMLGMYLLYKAMLIFLNEGERQLRPDDID